MGVFGLVLMSSLWPNMIGISNQLARNCPTQSGSRQTSTRRWWWLFASWNYWQYGGIDWCYIRYPHNTHFDDWLLFIIVKNAITGVVVVMSLSRAFRAPWPQLTGFHWFLYSLSVVGVWVVVWWERTVVNYIMVHAGVLFLIGLTLVSVRLHPCRLDLPQQHRCTETKLWYDLLYASLYLVYIGTLHQLVRYEFDVLATIWRNFALNVASYFYVLAKYLILPDLRARIDVTQLDPCLHPKGPLAVR
jgi:hypothetical protein